MLFSLALALFSFSQKAPSIDEIVVPGKHPTLVLDGLKFLEGPAWTRDGHLIFSDIIGDTVYELRDGKAVPMIKPSQRAIGNTIDREGRIVTCHQGSRSVTRMEKNGSVTVLADRFEGKKLNSPDDVIVRSDGTIYFTDPGFGLKPADRELPFDGVYKISTDGKLDFLLKDFNKPNGLAFSPDEKHLYINDTVLRQIRVFDVAPSGVLFNGKLFAYMTGEMAGEANGMKVDAKGNVYSTGPGGIQVFTPEGKYIGIILSTKVISNFCFGDPDGKTLYMTSGHSLYKTSVKIAGVSFAGRNGLL